MTLLVHNESIPEEESALILSSISMNLLMQEDLDVSGRFVVSTALTGR